MASEVIEQLRASLAKSRRERRGAPRKKARQQAAALQTVRSKCGPAGEMREHPLKVGLMWLHQMGQALIVSGVCFNSRIAVKDWERDGCVGLWLQRIARGKFGLPEGGFWEQRRVPVEICNAQDTKALLARLVEPAVADLLFASNDAIRVAHHGN
jgi:hypothetical protein